MDSLTFGEQNGGGLVMNFCETRNSINQENQFNGTMSKCLKFMYLKNVLGFKTWVCKFNLEFYFSWSSCFELVIRGRYSRANT